MPWEHVAMKDPTAYLKAEDVLEMIDEEPVLRNKLIIRMLFTGGMRVSELCGTLTRDILWDENCILIPWLKKRREPGKPPRKRKIALEVGTFQMIADWINLRRAKKWRLRDPRLIPLNRKRVYHIVREAAERVNINQVGDPSNPHYPHPHTLRHSYATHRVSRSQGRIEVLSRIQEAMGHSDLLTTTSYLHTDPGELHRGFDEVWDGVFPKKVATSKG